MRSARSTYPQVDPRAQGGVTAAVREVPPNLPLGEAQTIMTSERIPFLVAKVGRRVGLVERSAVDQAVAWGLGKSSVALVVCLDVPVLSADTQEVRLRRLLLRERRALVGEPGRWHGVAECSSVPPVPHLVKTELSGASGTFRGLLEAASGVADEQSLRVALVGGAVRDLFLGARDVDVDLAVEGDGLAFAQRLGRRLKARVTLHPQFLKNTRLRGKLAKSLLKLIVVPSILHAQSARTVPNPLFLHLSKPGRNLVRRFLLKFTRTRRYAVESILNRILQRLALISLNPDMPAP